MTHSYVWCCRPIFITNAVSNITTYCKTLQHITTHCQTLQRTATHCNTLQQTATHCNTTDTQAAEEPCNEIHFEVDILLIALQHTAKHCNALQHNATHCNTLQHSATHCNTPQHETYTGSGGAMQRPTSRGRLRGC